MNIYGWNAVNDCAPINSNKEPVLVTVEESGSRWVIPDAVYHRGKWYQKIVEGHYEYGTNPWDEIYVDELYEEIMLKVIAWMYQPDPYEAPTEPERAEE